MCKCLEVKLKSGMFKNHRSPFFQVEINSKWIGVLSGLPEVLGVYSRNNKRFRSQERGDVTEVLRGFIWLHSEKQTVGLRKHKGQSLCRLLL